MDGSSRNPANLIPAIMGFIFLAIFWVVMFPSVLGFETQWTAGGGAELGPGPLGPVLLFGVIWTGACLVFIIVGVGTFLRGSTGARFGRDRRYHEEAGPSYTSYHRKIDTRRTGSTGYSSSQARTNTCPSCRKMVQKEDMFCPNCGFKL
ncbi:MAG: zinc-ribbon domain-containing protein [Candidatus Odinarchaeota archaeon]